jgi:hypothetical protein
MWLLDMCIGKEMEHVIMCVCKWVIHIVATTYVDACGWLLVNTWLTIVVS